MHSPGTDDRGERIAASLYTVGNMVGAEGPEVPDMAPDDVVTINELMAAFGRLQRVERQLAEASRRYMKLSALDMRALHFLIIAKHQGEIVTPGMIADYLEISAASTTKLLNRLEEGGHIVRHVHPTDRRAFSIEVTPETAAAAYKTVGVHQSRRVFAALRLTPEERAIVTRFINDMTDELSTSIARQPEPSEATA